MDEWLSMQGSAPQRNPEEKDTAAVRPRNFTYFSAQAIPILGYNGIIIVTMDSPKIQIYLHLVKNIAAFLAISRLYKLDHPTIRARSTEVLKELEDVGLKADSMTFSVQGNLLFLNGEELQVRDRLSKVFVEDFGKLKLGSLDLEPGLTVDELNMFMLLLNSTAKVSGDDQVKAFLSEHGAKHITPHFASYKLVQEDEKVVKGSEVVDINRLSPDAVRAFSDDLKNSVIKNKDLAHNAGFLSSVLTDMTKAATTPEDLLKVVWVIGEYLIDEMTTAKEEEMNQKLLHQLKGHLLTLWEERPDKDAWRDKVEESFTKIVVAIELKRYMVSYKRHKKGMETAYKKVKSLMRNLPEGSRIYQKIDEDLKKIGLPKLNLD